jgi:hypothetical protein
MEVVTYESTQRWPICYATKRQHSSYIKLSILKVD